jgi:hypothetical protein
MCEFAQGICDGVNTLCECAVRNRTGARASIDDAELKHSKHRGANMMTKQSLSRIADMVLVSLLALAATFVTLSAVLGPPSLWMLPR